jgi:hypothetical protein
MRDHQPATQRKGLLLAMQEQLRECRAQLSQFLSPAAMGLQQQQEQQPQQQQQDPLGGSSSPQQESHQLLQRLVALEQHYHCQMGSLEHQILQLRASDGDLSSVRAQFHHHLASLENEVGLRLGPLPFPFRPQVGTYPTAPTKPNQSIPTRPSRRLAFAATTPARPPQHIRCQVWHSL